MTKIVLPYTSEDHVEVLMKRSSNFRKLVETFDLQIDYSVNRLKSQHYKSLYNHGKK
jgi:hypothetical protein